MARLHFSARVYDDLLRIRDFIGIDSPLNAGRFVDRLEKECRKLAQTPFLGRKRSELASDLRSIAFGSYVIFYRATSSDVLIIAIIHGSRNLEKALKDVV